MQEDRRIATTAADVASDEQLREVLSDFASWPTRPQSVALEALVAAHGHVKTSRVKTPAQQIDHLRVTWGTATYSPDGGVLLDAQGDPVEPRDPQSMTIGLPLDVLLGLLGADLLRGHLQALRDKAAAKGSSEVEIYAFDTELARDVVTAAKALLQWRADALETFAAVEADLTSALAVADETPGVTGAQVGRLAQQAEAVRDMIARVPVL